jgi:hypothetical protein
MLKFCRITPVKLVTVSQSRMKVDLKLTQETTTTQIDPSTFDTTIEYYQTTTEYTYYTSEVTFTPTTEQVMDDVKSRLPQIPPALLILSLYQLLLVLHLHLLAHQLVLILKIVPRLALLQLQQVPQPLFLVLLRPIQCHHHQQRQLHLPSCLVL